MKKQRAKRAKRLFRGFYEHTRTEMFVICLFAFLFDDASLILDEFVFVDGSSVRFIVLRSSEMTRAA